MLGLVAIAPLWSSEHERAIDASESAGVRQDNIDAGGSRNERDVVEIAARPRLFEIDGGRNGLLIQHQRADDGLDSAGRALSVSNHRFGGADGNVICPFAKNSLVR